MAGRAAPVRARRLCAGAPGRAARQPLGRGRRRRAPGDRARAPRSRPPTPSRDHVEAGRVARQPALGGGLPRATRALLATGSPHPSSTHGRRRRLEERIRRRFARARARTIVLDYDGTLREFERHPDLAQPTPEIRALLRSLAALPATDVHIVSGRRRRNLEQWFGRLPVYLCAEHGYLARAPGGEWRTLVDLDLSWLPPDRATASEGRGRRAGSARRAEVVQRRLALPRGRARVRLVAGARASERPRPAPRRCTGRDPARAPGRGGACAGRRQGRLRAEPVPGREGVVALRPRAR